MVKFNIKSTQYLLWNIIKTYNATVISYNDDGTEVSTIETVFTSFKKWFIEDYNYVYVVSEDGDNAKVLRYNFTKPLNNENTELITLDGLKNINDMKIDSYKKKIYLSVGDMTTEMYQKDKDLNKLEISQLCGIDFLKISPEWGPVMTFSFDENTGFMYLPLSTRHNYAGIIKGRTKDFNLDSSITKFQEKYHRHNDNVRDVF